MLLCGPAFPIVALQASLGLGPLTWVERETFVMGTVLHVEVAANARAAGVRAIEGAFTAVRRLDGVLSTWRDDTDIARLNGTPAGHALPVSDTLYHLLREADRWIPATGGAFDPLLGRGRLTFDDVTQTVTRPSDDARFDTGGFGKGVALREAARALARAGVTSALLNFGGHVYALGAAADGRAWPVPVAHPLHRSEPAALLRLRNRSASTSSQSEHPDHIIDPRTGRPAPAWGSVTVVAEDPALADIMSTALYVMGPNAGLRWARERRDIGALFLIDEQGQLRQQWNRTMVSYLVNKSTHQITSNGQGG